MVIVCMQMDVFSTFIELLRQTGNVTKGQVDMNELRQVLLFYNYFLFICAFVCACFFWCIVCDDLIFGTKKCFHGANKKIL